MLINWNIVTALAACVAALAAVITTIVIIWQTRYTIKIQTFGQMLTAWQSPPLLPTMRHAAADTILTSLHKANLHHAAAATAIKSATGLNLPLSGYLARVDEVLDFFDMLGFFVKKGALDFELTYHTFYWAMTCYWIMVESYIREAQATEGNELWQDYSDFLIPKLIKRAGTEITIKDATRFFEDELARTI